ncbi:MAG: BadF/BadG/BcrA/BcrD ATPase family protein [Acutalibacteraceae bacterium]|nr:BadF/BadG/BcrA/BcrD ATPase family protein [Acutalibacteraceae bacterium]
MKYYIGVDGGGTKTAFALFDENKKMLDSVTGPGSNHENLESSFDGASDIIMEGLNALCAKAGISLSDVSFTLMGLAGIDHEYQYDIMCDMLKKKGLANFEVFNDGFIVVKAGASGKSAIGYNCGTGVCCNGIDLDGKRLQLAGLGDFSGDISGGGNIVVEAFRLVYNELFLGLEKTLITDMVNKEYGFKSREEFLGLIEKIEGEDGADYIRTMVGFFFEAVKQGDKPATEYCDRMATRGAQLISALASQMNFGDGEVEVVLSGSINVKLDNKYYLDALLSKAESMSGKKLKFVKLEAMPVTGCINWIMQDYAN